MRNKIAVAAIVAVLLGGTGFAGTAAAAKPANQACVGDLFNGTAPEEGGPVAGAGAMVSEQARNQPFGISFGKQIQALQSGFVPDSIQPNSCNG